jgi:hypothetical protein
MAIDSICAKCGKQLRVADEHAGQQARCPNCQTIYTVPQLGAAAALAAVSPGGKFPDSWQMKTPEGLVYGPVVKAELDRWLEQGRITPRCQILQEGEQQWHWAAEVYQELRDAAPMAPVQQTGQIQPYAPMAPPGTGAYYPQAHRGVLVLVLAILGYVSCCFAVSIIAIVLGMIDLGEMKAGRMDPAGRPITIVGIILAAVWIVGNLCYVGFMVLAEMGFFG